MVVEELHIYMKTFHSVDTFLAMCEKSPRIAFQVNTLIRRSFGVPSFSTDLQRLSHKLGDKIATILAYDKQQKTVAGLVQLHIKDETATAVLANLCRARTYSGLGAYLLLSARGVIRQHYEEIYRIHLHVDPAKKKLQHFYEQQGWILVDTSNDDYYTYESKIHRMPSASADDEINFIIVSTTTKEEEKKDRSVIS